MNQLWIIFISVLIVVITSRIITFAVLEWKILPKRVLSNGKRVHHFVYGNILIVIAALLSIGLGQGDSWLTALIFGIGLGLVLDEFPHWTGNVKELTRNTPIIPGAIPAVIIAELIILGMIMLKLLTVI